MFKKSVLILSLLSTPVMAGEWKLNIPVAAKHFGNRHDGGKWNEQYLDDLAVGASFSANNGVGVSVNTSINSYGANRSVYVTADYLPEIYAGKYANVNLGGHVGFATGYKELSNSGFIPFVGASAEVEFGALSFMATVTPSYKEAPSALIGMIRLDATELVNDIF